MGSDRVAAALRMTAVSLERTHSMGKRLTYRKLGGSGEFRPACSQPHPLQMPLRAEYNPRRHLTTIPSNSVRLLDGILKLGPSAR